jgi:hypothetical protein
MLSLFYFLLAILASPFKSRKAGLKLRMQRFDTS